MEDGGEVPAFGVDEVELIFDAIDKRITEAGFGIHDGLTVIESGPVSGVFAGGVEEFFFGSEIGHQVGEGRFEDIDGQDIALVIEAHGRDTGFAVVTVAIGDLESVVGDEPFIAAGDLDDGMVAGGFDDAFLFQDGVVFGGSERTGGCGAGGVIDAVAGIAGVEGGPHEVVAAVAFKNKGTFVIAFGGDAFDLIGRVGDHIVVEFDDVAVALAEVEPGAAIIIDKNHGIDGLAAVGATGDQRLAERIFERAGGCVGDGDTNLLSGREIEIVFAVFGGDTGRPGVGVGPGEVFFEIKDDTFVFPVDQVGGGPAGKTGRTPAFEAIGRGVNVVNAVEYGNMRIGMGAGQGGCDVRFLAESGQGEQAGQEEGQG